MKLKLTRDIFSKTFTLGKLYVNGVFLCYTLEDTDRFLERDLSSLKQTKQYGLTAIPRSSSTKPYKVSLTYSPKYKRILPYLHDVAGFEGIRIHPGNSPADTEGCILVGADRDAHAGLVLKSRNAFAELFELLQEAAKAGEEITMEID